MFNHEITRDTSLFAICMVFAHKYINIRRIIYEYILVYKYINIKLQNGGNIYPARYLTMFLLV